MNIGDRFISKVYKVPNGCWMWTAGKDTCGYGKFFYKGQMECAHRISHILFIGPIPSDLYVCHSCDNPSCVNPSHLFLGRQIDNLRDARRKCRSVGRKPYKGIDIGQLQKLQIDGLSQIEIATILGCSQPYVGRLLSNWGLR